MRDNFYVNPEGDLAIEAIARAQSIKRWHMVDTTRVQSLAEHSANVATLAYYICISSPQAYFGSPADAALAGLLHDIPESFTGDIPSHTKRELLGIDELENELTPAVLIRPMNENMANLIKLCDLADGIRFIRVHGADATAQWACDGLSDQLKNRESVVSSLWPSHVKEHVMAKIHYYIFNT